MSAPLNFNPEEILPRTMALFEAERGKDLRDTIGEKIAHLQQYDVLAMDRALAILAWGRSGSLLLSSYLDGHADIIMLPELCGERLYEFYDRYRSLPWGDRLLAYAAFEPDYPGFFTGNFAISATQYYAAVQAILERYEKWEPEFLASRKAFFLFVHIAYNLAVGRHPASSHPLIVFAHHSWGHVVAGYLVEDFPQTKFVHTIRDPISGCDRMFHYLFGRSAELVPRTYIRAPYSAIHCLINNDRPLPGMESRTRTVRFEDMHSDTAAVMRDLCNWLDIPYQSKLVDSTFNGVPWVVSRDGKSWSGRRLEQIQRHSQYLSMKDRGLLFSMFYQNFVEWGYPCPKSFGNSIVRCIVFVSLFLLPTKMEFLAARALFKSRILPSLRRGKIWLAIKSLLAIGFCRLEIIWLLTPAFFERCAYRTVLLQVDQKLDLVERGELGAEGLQEIK